jgi:hypothetical protein
MEDITGEKKNHRIEEWYDDKCKEAVRLKNKARQTVLNR